MILDVKVEAAAGIGPSLRVSRKNAVGLNPGRGPIHETGLRKRHRRGPICSELFVLLRRYCTAKIKFVDAFLDLLYFFVTMHKLWLVS